MRIPSLLVLLLWTIVVAVACSTDTPIDTKQGLLDSDELGDVVFVESNQPAADTSAFSETNTGDSIYLLAGDFDGIESRFLIRFPLPPETGTVTAAQLLLPIHLFMGSGDTFEASVHQVTAAWQDTSATWESFGDQMDPAALDTQDYAIPDSLVTDSDTLVFDIPPDVVNGWRADSTTNYGLLVKSRMVDNLLLHFHSSENFNRQPSLKLVAESGDSSATSFHAPDADVFIFQRHTELQPGPLYLGNGEVHRALVAFDISFLPKDATINRCELTLTIDDSNSVLNRDQFPFRPFSVDSNSVDNVDPSLAVLDSVRFIPGSFVGPDSPSIIISIAGLVQYLIQQNQKKLVLVLVPQATRRDLQRVAFHSSRSSSDQGPRLTVDYTVPPKSD